MTVGGLGVKYRKLGVEIKVIELVETAGRALGTEWPA
jgi:hypothetical protein